MGCNVPDTVAAALARAQSKLDGRLQAQVSAFLAAAPARVCAMCPRESRARYPDLRCAEHTVYLDGETALRRRRQGNDRALYLDVWRRFFEGIARILRA